MKSTKTLSIVLLLVSLLANAALAVEHLHGFEIRRLLSGITLDGVYRGGAFFSETYNEDGTLRYRDGSSADTGRWEAATDLFCTYYEHQQGGCFYVASDGSN